MTRAEAKGQHPRHQTVARIEAGDLREEALRASRHPPDGPEILSPAAGSRVARDQVVVKWAPVTTPAGIDIAGYQVLVVR